MAEGIGSGREGGGGEGQEGMDGQGEWESRMGMGNKG